MSILWTPKPYHLQAVSFGLSHPKNGLILDMGLGKTAVSLAVISSLLEAKELPYPVLLSAPMRTLSTVWPVEIKKWAEFSHLRYWNAHKDGWPTKMPHIIGVSPAQLSNLLEAKALRSCKFSMLLIDESAGYRNHQSKRFSLLRDELHHFPRRSILTGTFAPNGLINIWAQMYIVDRGESLGKRITHFRNDFCDRDISGFKWTVKPLLRPMVYERISPYCLRMDKREHLNIREPVINRLVVSLPPEARRRYDEMEQEFITVVKEETIYSPNAGVAGGRCRQIANGGIYKPETKEYLHIHDAKTEALVELMEGLQGKPLLLFYEFHHDLMRINQAFPNVPNLTVTNEPEWMVKEFNKGNIPLMVMAPQTTVGLNLQDSCRDLCWYGVPWDLYVHDQACARIWGRGDQLHDVTFHYIMADRTRDFKAERVLTSKRREQEDLYKALGEYNE